MGRNNWFQFKKFTVVQEQAAMKVGTDGVLLGAWADVANVNSILDIGTGTGLIALMMAQRSQAEITGIEIERKAAEEAEFNVIQSPWTSRIEIISTSFQEYAKSNPGLFDLIISNPPFFGNGHKSKCEMLAMAKHNHLLPPADLISCAVGLLAPKGKLAVILPADSSEPFKKLAEKKQLYLLRETEVRPNNLKKTHRCLLEFGRENIHQVSRDCLLIHTDDGMDFTEKYKALTREFYLNF